MKKFFATKDVFSWYWAAVIVALPVFTRLEANVDIRYAKNLYFVFVVFLSIVLFGIKLKKEHGIYVVCAGILSIMSYYTLFSINNFSTIFQFISLNAGLMCLLQFITRELNSKIIINSMAVTCIIQSVWVILQDFQIFPYDNLNELLFGVKRKMVVKTCHATGGCEWKKYDGTFLIEVHGSLGHKTLSGALIAITSTALLRKYWFILLIPAIVAVTICESTMATGTMFLAIVTLATLKLFDKISKRNLIISLSIMLVGCLVFYLGFLNDKANFFRDSSRFIAWRALLDWGTNIFHGEGLGYLAEKFSPMMLRDHHEVFRHAHNELLEVYIAFGLIGVAIVILFLSRIRIKNIIMASSLIALLANSLASFPFHIAPIALIGLVCYSLNIDRRSNLK